MQIKDYNNKSKLYIKKLCRVEPREQNLSSLEFISRDERFFIICESNYLMI